MALQLEPEPLRLFPENIIAALKAGGDAEMVLRATDDALGYLREEFRITENLYRSAVLVAESREREFNEARAELNKAERAAMEIYRSYMGRESESSVLDSESDDLEHHSP